MGLSKSIRNQPRMELERASSIYPCRLQPHEFLSDLEGPIQQHGGPQLTACSPASYAQ